MTVAASCFKEASSCGFSSPNVASLRMEVERWGPYAQCGFVWGTAGKGSRIRMWRTLAVNRLIQDHWFLVLFSFLLDTICIANGSSVTLAFFLESEKIVGVQGDQGFPQHTPPPSVLPLVPGSHYSCLSPLSQDFSQLRKAQQAHCSAKRRLGQLCCPNVAVLSPLTSP